jgi:hypothetical protein
MAKYLLIAILIVAGIVATRIVNNPLNTHLPLSNAEMAALTAELDALEPEERRLVLAYMQRSNGDRVPAMVGDPDAPLTASTFGEAVELQKAYETKYPGSL